MITQKWYYMAGSQRVGPLTFDELKAKNLLGETQVYCALLGKWAKASGVQELEIDDIPAAPVDEVPPLPSVPAKNDFFKKYYEICVQFWKNATPNQKYLVIGTGILLLFLVYYFGFRSSPEDEIVREARDGIRRWNSIFK